MDTITTLTDIIERKTTVRGFNPARMLFNRRSNIPGTQVDLQFQLALMDHYDGKLTVKMPIPAVKNHFESVFENNIIYPADLSVEGVNRLWQSAEDSYFYSLIKDAIRESLL